MRCPKCHYLSFEPEPRCKNCGYGFSLAEPDLLMRDPERPEEEPLADLTFRPAVTNAPPEAALDRPKPPRAPAGRTAPAPSAAAVSGGAQRRVESPRPSPTTELPLFVKALSASEAAAPARTSEPLVRMPLEPRAPLAVRRKPVDAVAHAPRAHPTERAAAARPRPPVANPRKLGPLDRDLLDDLRRIETIERREIAGSHAGTPPYAGAGRAGAAKRLAAAAVDGALLGGLAALVLWVTLRWCGLPLDRISVLPVLPTAAFVLLLGLAYLLLFTAAGGQTLGKMLLGLRVVGDADDEQPVCSLTFGQAAYREALALPSMLALGVGFAPALVGDERALHDRLAHTRVVRA